MKKNSIDFRLPGGVDPAWRVAIVHALYYEEEVAAMVVTAKDALLAAGIPEGNISLFPVFGSSEVPLIGTAIARNRSADAIIGLGIVVQGETKHAEHLSRAVARGMMDVQLEYGMPFAYGVLHVTDIAQARARPEKGRECAFAVLHSLAQLKRLQS
ncbi:MAG: 6,7-dimethyl-8-ribityllumazine synthase [Candidatus Peribacteraceae bacterium]|nr:6,7-dimethyl-8-ribityllumazine synthase [Candidatus Peribacteraceae bacterium]